ncbi:MAG: 3-phosphoshikimate 1-carboxyvinyltransferase [Oscillospiraceae bacterium]|jgi:3-phosphoshikimate 1-carboxyvinyltransferase|nr:3-phosphoshikimate 1-carboxyvinyltransferase [Oscillospiraceae bacterium]
MNIKITPRKLAGEIAAITSKSAAHRALICAFLCKEKPEIKIENTSKDIEATLACLEAMKNKSAPLINCGESGSTFRFLLPLAAHLCENAKFIGEGRLPQRPIEDLLDALRANGVNFSSEKLPFTVSGKLQGGKFVLPGNVSSQFVSGLLFVLPLLNGDSEIKLTTPLESKSYADMTVDMLRKFGIEIIEKNNYYEVKCNQIYKSPKIIEVEKDWSNAAFFLSANALGADIKITGLDINSVQGDKEIVSILKRFMESEDLRGVGIDVSEIPDLLPILAVVAAFAKGETVLYNAARLRLKESDRLSAVSEMLKIFGAEVEEKSDSLIISGGKLKGGIVDSAGDHRIVMSAAICGCFCEGETIIKGAEAVEKSYPNFFEDFAKLGGKADVI